jgi:hypothetical protein
LLPYLLPRQKREEQYRKIVTGTGYSIGSVPEQIQSTSAKEPVPGMGDITITMDMGIRSGTALEILIEVR